MSGCTDCGSITLFKGEDGKTIYNGVIDPILTNVNEGDFYINTVTWEIFGPYTAGSWGVGTPLIGPTGAAGADGADGAVGPAGGNGSALINTVFTEEQKPFAYAYNQYNSWLEVGTIYFPGTTALGATPTASKVILHADFEITTALTFDIRIRNTTAGNTLATLSGQTIFTKSIFDLGALLAAALTATEGIYVLEVQINYADDPLNPNYGGLKIYSLAIL